MGVYVKNFVESRIYKKDKFKQKLIDLTNCFTPGKILNFCFINIQ